MDAYTTSDERWERAGVILPNNVCVYWDMYHKANPGKCGVLTDVGKMVALEPYLVPSGGVGCEWREATSRLVEGLWLEGEETVFDGGV